MNPLHPSFDQPIPVAADHRFQFDCTLCGACCFARVQLYPLDVRRLLTDSAACRVHRCPSLAGLVAGGWVRFVQDERTGVPVALLGQNHADPRQPCRFLRRQRQGGPRLRQAQADPFVYHCLLHATAAKPTICRAMPLERYAQPPGACLHLHLRLPAPDCLALGGGAWFTVGQWMERNGLVADYAHADEFLSWAFWLAKRPLSPSDWPQEAFQMLLRLWYDPALGTWEKAVASTPALMGWVERQVRPGR